MRALARHAQGDHDGALADLDAALAVDGEHADIRNDRGRVNTARRDLVAARADYDAAARLSPNWSRPHANRGWAAILADDLDEATRAFSCALALDADDVLALCGRAVVARRRGDALSADAERGIALMNDPEVARMIAAIGIAPLADLALAPSLEP